MIKTFKPRSCLLNISKTHLPQRFYTAVKNISLTHFPTVQQDFYFSHLLGQTCTSANWSLFDHFFSHEDKNRSTDARSGKLGGCSSAVTDVVLAG